MQPLTRHDHVLTEDQRAERLAQTRDIMDGVKQAFDRGTAVLPNSSDSAATRSSLADLAKAWTLLVELEINLEAMAPKPRPQAPSKKAP